MAVHGCAMRHVVLIRVPRNGQVLLSARRQSTDGFAIGPVLCDFAGGILSIAQQVGMESIDC